MYKNYGAEISARRLVAEARREKRLRNRQEKSEQRKAAREIKSQLDDASSQNT
jgi:hypothetical protein